MPSMVQRTHIESMVYTGGIERTACSDICGKQERDESGTIIISSLPYDYLEFDSFDSAKTWKERHYEELIACLKVVDRKTSLHNVTMTASLLLQQEKILFPEQAKTDSRYYGLCQTTFRGNGFIRHMSHPVTPDLGERVIDSVLDRKLIEGMQSLQFRRKKRIDHEYDVVMRSCESGYFFHEIVGHCLEADIASMRRDQNIAKTWTLGSTVSQCHLTIYDDPLSSRCFSFGKCDDEGSALGKTILVLDDQLVGYMCDKYYAAYYGLNGRTGCSRRQSFHSESIPRMYCTVVEFGNRGGGKRDADCDPTQNNCFVVEQVVAGSMVINSRMFRIVCSGYLHQSGHAIAYSPNAIVSGDVEAVLMQVVPLNDSTACVEMPFFCFKKGQRVFVSAKAPSVRFKHIDVLGEFYEP